MVVFVHYATVCKSSFTFAWTHITHKHAHTSEKMVAHFSRPQLHLTFITEQEQYIHHCVGGARKCTPAAMTGCSCTCRVTTSCRRSPLLASTAQARPSVSSRFQYATFSGCDSGSRECGNISARISSSDMCWWRSFRTR